MRIRAILETVVDKKIEIELEFQNENSKGISSWLMTKPLKLTNKRFKGHRSEPLLYPLVRAITWVVNNEKNNWWQDTTIKRDEDFAVRECGEESIQVKPEVVVEPDPERTPEQQEEWERQGQEEFAEMFLRKEVK